MNSSDEKLISWLFETKAVRVCPENRPFWYTSGTIGPYYINTHFLYGSERKANDLLEIIDAEKNDKYTCPQKVINAIKDNYNNDNIYRGLINEMCLYIKSNIDLDNVDCISGGERRDWFFSPIIAEMLAKPHITIYKDTTCVISDSEGTRELKTLNGKKVLHIADLITEASSYSRAWIPAIRSRGGEIKWSVVVVDRKQGGEELLSGEGIKSFAMVSIDKRLFDKALSLNLISNEQYNMIVDYTNNPKESMKRFLQDHPEFLKHALNADDKTKERAQLCLEKNLYDLDI